MGPAFTGRSDMTEPEQGSGADHERRRRNLVIALSLLAFVALVFLITIVKLGAGG